MDIPALIAVEKLLREIRSVDADKPCGVHSEPTPSCYFCVWDALTALSVRIEQHRGALGYSVPGHIADDPTIRNGIAEALHQQLAALSASHEALTAMQLYTLQQLEAAEAQVAALTAERERR
jgi:hypothetical protein